MDQLVTKIDTIVASVPARTAASRYRSCRGSALTRSSFGPVLGKQRPDEVVVDVVDSSEQASSELVRRIVDVAGEHLDREHALVLMGEEHVVLAGEGPVAFAFLLRRRAPLDHEGFLDYWRTQHTDRSVPPLAGYRQLHVDLRETAAICRSLELPAPAFDGVATAFYRDEADFLEVSAHPSIAIHARRDERHFIDHARSAGALWCRLEPTPG